MRPESEALAPVQTPPMMTFTKILPVALFLALAACSSEMKDPGAADAEAPKDASVATDAGTTKSIACSIPTQDRCKEFPMPSEDQLANLPVECSSVSGMISTPAECPKVGFVGKCTVAGIGKDGPEVRRFYKASDAAYQQDFCVDTAMGTWSTTF